MCEDDLGYTWKLPPGNISQLPLVLGQLVIYDEVDIS
jgi:hypothetical protein